MRQGAGPDAGSLGLRQMGPAQLSGQVVRGLTTSLPGVRCPAIGWLAEIADIVKEASTYLGGTGSDLGQDVAVDSAGRAYLTGIHQFD